MDPIVQSEDLLSERPGYRRVRLERVSDNCWCARDRSAFLICLLMPQRGVRCYSRGGRSITELTAFGFTELQNRAEVIGMDRNEAVFDLFFPAPVPDWTFLKWKASLPCLP